MLKITIWKTSAAKAEEWDWWANRYFLNSDSAGRDTIEEWAYQLMDFEGGLHRSDTTFIAASAVAGYNEMAPEESGTHYTFPPYNHGTHFRHPASDIAMWRYKLGVRKATVQGRHTHTRYTNCLNDNDFYHDSAGRIALKADYREYLDGWIRDARANMGVFSRELAMVKPPIPFMPSIGVPVTTRYGAFAIDAHANTRWRRRLSQNGKPLFKKVAGLAIEVEKQQVANKEMIDYDIDFVPSIYYENTVKLLKTPIQLSSETKDFFKDADGDSNNGEEKPVTRNGSTGAKLQAALTKWKDYADNQLPDLIKIHKPNPYIDGRDYIKSKDLEVFDDLLNDMSKELGVGWEFDWLNPFAYEKNSENWMDSKQTPDIVELYL